MSVLSIALVTAGCGTLRIHSPQDLANAQQAQTQFKAAALTETVAAERDRLGDVLAKELDLVEKHTLARRDSRLLYVIGEGDTIEAWSFLKDDIAKRLGELGVEPTELKNFMRRQARAETQRRLLIESQGFYAAERKKNGTLPAFRCPLPPNVERPTDFIAREFWDDAEQNCDKYLAIRRGRADGNGMPLDAPLANGAVINAMRAAKAAAREVTEKARQNLENAREEYRKSMRRADVDAQQAAREAMRAAAQRLIEKADKFKGALENLIEDKDDGSALRALGLQDVADKITVANTALSSLGLGATIPDLGALPAVARLEATRNELVTGLASILQGETATKVFASLDAIGAGLQDPARAPLTALVLKEKQIGLDIDAARKREAFFDKTLALLEEQDEAYRLELAFLGPAELLRQELEHDGCLSTASTGKSDFLENLFTDRSVRVVKCRERVFRLLVQYSSAWTLGRVKSEQIDYRLIALHHESALDTSEIAIQKWQSILGLPIDQLVALYATGLKTEHILSIASALGIGAIAVGVN